jgi:hypothetical protein
MRLGQRFYLIPVSIKILCLNENKKSKPKTLQCTILRVVPSAVCEALMAPLAGTTADPETTSVAPGPSYEIICTNNIDDKNACGGDLGAPFYIYIYFLI